MNAKHMTGWVAPPRPIQIVPSIDASQSFATQARNVLLDFIHAPALFGWVGHYSSAFGGNPHAWEVNPEDLVRLYFTHTTFTPQQLQQYYTGTGVDPAWQGMDSNGTKFTYDSSLPMGVGDAAWNDLDQALRAEVTSRLNVGPLPPNDYGDPITLYYYDEGLLKKVVYPRSDLATALDPNNPQFWKGGNIGTYESSDHGVTWGNEGISWDKDIAGSIGQIVASILAIVGTILSLTGVGAAAGAALLATSAAIGAWANVVDQSLIGGDVAGALGGFFSAFAKMAGATGAGKFMGLDKAKTTALLTNLSRLIPIVQHAQSQGLGFAAAYQLVKSQASSLTPIDDDQIAAMTLAMGGVTSTAGRVFTAGVNVAKFATPQDIEGITSILPVDTGTLFEIGAYLGKLEADQQTGAVLSNAAALTSSGLAGHITPIAALLDPTRQLMTFVVTVLKPRYHL